MAEKKEQKIIGGMSCLLCGNPVSVRVDGGGRAFYVCKWQDDGCGLLVQSNGPDASRALVAKVKASAKKAADQEKASHSETAGGKAVEETGASKPIEGGLLDEFV